MQERTRRRILQSTGMVAAGMAAGCLGDGNGSDGGSGGSSGGSGGSDGQSGGSDGASGSDGGSGGSETFQTTIAVSTWPAAPFGLTIRVAQEQGFFEENDISIDELISFGSGGDSVRGVVTGGIGVGMTAFNAAINAYDAGAAIQIVGNNTARSIIDWVAQPDSEIESIHDTEGATIAVGNSGSGSEALVYLMYEMTDGVSHEDIEILNTGGMTDSQTVLQEGEADVAYSSPPLTQMRESSGQLRKVWSTNEFVPNFTENVFIAGTPVLNDNPELIQGLLASANQAHEFIANNPDESATIWGEDASFYSVEQAKAAVNYFINELGSNYYSIELEEETIKAPARALQIMGQRDEEPPWGEILNQSALPEDKQVDWF